MSRTRLLALSIDRRYALSVIVWAMLAMCSLQGVLSPQVRRPPSFADYPVSAIYRGPVAPPRFGPTEQYQGTDLRCFGGSPEEYTGRHVDFAGHFIVGHCSCGTGCSYLYLWDARTGKFYRLLDLALINVGPFLDPNGPLVKYTGASYRADSSLLVLDGCVEGTCDCAKRYYVWRNGEFSPIYRQAETVPPRCHGHGAFG
jgi:hypothetical protein